MIIKQTNDPQTKRFIGMNVIFVDYMLIQMFLQKMTKKKFDQTKCTDAIEFSGIEWRHSRFHYGINHFQKIEGGVKVNCVYKWILGPQAIRDCLFLLEIIYDGGI